MTFDSAAYNAFLERKQLVDLPTGIDIAADQLDERLFGFQREITAWALRRGRAAILAATGLGKTAMQLVWADHVARSTGNPVLILAPLAVSAQTAREGEKFGVDVTVCRTAADMSVGVNVTNYERLAHFDARGLAGVVLDESSILKSLDGPTRKALTEFGEHVAFRLCCSATPAPNEWTEIGAQSQFLGVLTQKEMLALYFTQDGYSTQKWLL